jgi:hypothetical protein
MVPRGPAATPMIGGFATDAGNVSRPTSRAFRGKTLGSVVRQFDAVDEARFDWPFSAKGTPVRASGRWGFQTSLCGGSARGVARALHQTPNCLRRKAIHVDHDHHARAQIAEAKVLHDEAVIIELLPLTVDQVHDAADRRNSCRAAARHGRQALLPVSRRAHCR